MNTKFAGLVAGVAVTLASLGASAPAEAAIIDISATTTQGATFTFDPGTYLIQWIGVADGGAYDAWNPNCPTGDCTSGWRDVFAVTTDTGQLIDFTTYTIPGPTFASPLASITAFKAAPSILASDFHWNGVSFAPDGQKLIAQPWIVTVDSTTTIGLFIPDATKADNYGGVSLKISAVPEPSTWAMMILGLGGAGAMLRRRRRLAVG